MSTRTTTHNDANVVQHPDGVERGTTLPGGRYLSIREAAAELQVGYTAIWQAVQRERIMAVDIDGMTLIPAFEVAHYRDTRRASRGHTNDELAAQRNAAAKVQAPKARGEWKRQRVYYRLISGRQIILSRSHADVLSVIDTYRTPHGAGEITEAIYLNATGKLTRSRILTLIETLIQAGLVQRIGQRDDGGGAIHVLYLGVNGKHALRYCRDRGLI